MWKPNDKPSINTFTHIKKENLNFASTLRNDEDFVTTLHHKDVVKTRNVSFTEPEQSKYKPKDQIFLHIICNRPDCAKDVQDIADILDEREILIKTIEDQSALLIQLENEYVQINDEAIKLLAESDTLSKKYFALFQQESNILKPKLRALKDEHLLLDKETVQLQGIHDSLSAELQSKEVSRKLPYIMFETSKSPHVKLKHSGIYEITTGGRKLWSCCLKEDMYQRGCSDDTSAAEKTTLAWMGKSYPRPASAGGDSRWKFISTASPTTSSVWDVAPLNEPTETSPQDKKVSIVTERGHHHHGKEMHSPGQYSSFSPTDTPPSRRSTSSPQLMVLRPSTANHFHKDSNNNKALLSPSSSPSSPSIPMITKTMKKTATMISLQSQPIGRVREEYRKKLMTSTNRSMTSPIKQCFG
mmetsp:Transcript_21594/g.29867  ORF Transcript_21594/g.29867 Transcript_21594/m.29867 type:complete len:414 (+) Transcript_21594:35-1276(+)|eukprot:CAMPEP_0170115720 /NCGR_PEP_ID=MMETSP0020_2-20130122/11711_1 /TAXON_ID=98059 /ORGANISM="Dinobryon sp., Strain UTEXLB2267" /LENGTH=413 /DNA_ID=CAMNT_0010343439 /DNA_START=35 /DNA_END=1276 /DNA_ORIENTATION=-